MTNKNEILISLSPLFLFLILLVYGFTKTQYAIFQRKRHHPQSDPAPRLEDMFVAEVTTFYFSHGRTLSKTFHSTESAAVSRAKKDAKWFDRYGGVHRDVGIRWGVGKIREEDRQAA